MAAERVINFFELSALKVYFTSLGEESKKKATPVSKYKRGDEYYIIKTLPTEEEARIMHNEEKRVLLQIRHLNIIRVLNWASDSFGKEMVLMEFFEGRVLRGVHIPNERSLARIGIQVLHKRSICHLNIQPSNIMINAEGKVKLVGFGASRVFDHVAMAPVVPKPTMIPYLTPIAIRASEGLKGIGKQSAFLTDVWSFGMTMLEVYMGYYPINGVVGNKNPMECVTLIQDGLPGIIENLPPTLRSFFQSCFMMAPNAVRPSASTLIQHDIFALR